MSPAKVTIAVTLTNGDQHRIDTGTGDQSGIEADLVAKLAAGEGFVESVVVDPINTFANSHRTQTTRRLVIPARAVIAYSVTTTEDL